MLRAFALAALAFALPSQAYFTAFNATDKTVSPGETITVSFTTGDYPQQNKQYYAAFGLNPAVGAGLIGTSFGDGVDLLHSALSNTSTSKTYNLTLPSKLPGINGSDTTVLAAAVFQVAGASGEASVQTFNTTLKLAKGSEASQQDEAARRQVPAYLLLGAAVMLLPLICFV